MLTNRAKPCRSSCSKPLHRLYGSRIHRALMDRWAPCWNVGMLECLCYSIFPKGIGCEFNNSSGGLTGHFCVGQSRVDRPSSSAWGAPLVTLGGPASRAVHPASSSYVSSCREPHRQERPRAPGSDNSKSKQKLMIATYYLSLPKSMPMAPSATRSCHHFACCRWLGRYK